MYLQSIIGPRYFFPFKKIRYSHRYYYTKKEILEINKDYENVIR